MDKRNKYPFGAVYIIEQDYSDEEIQRDLQNMKQCGYNMVTFWPLTNPWLAKNSHELVFTATGKVLDICETLEIKAILQLFGQNQAQEFMPDSALTPDMEVHDEFGAFINDDCFWANLNHPTVRDYLDTYFRETITALKTYPAVFGWDVFNEAHFRSDDPWTLANYQAWLKEKYGTIEALNRDWYRRYESFSQVRPDKRRAPYSIWSSLLPELDYEQFRSENLTAICRFLYDTAKKYDDQHPIIIDGTSSQIMSPNVTMRNNDEFQTARIPDIYGSTFYPKSWGRNYKSTPWTLSMYFSIPAWASHKAGKPYFVNELQTHTQSALTPRSEVLPGEIQKWILMCLFTGAQAVQLWRWRPFLHGYQVTGRGLTDLDGSPNERSKAVEAVLKVIHGAAVFDGFTVSPPFIKIVFSYAVRLYFDALLKWKDSFWAKNVEGWYRLFWEQGMPAGFTDLEHLDTEDMKTPVLVLPGAVRIRSGEAEKLREYVEQGGFLIADGRMATLDEKATAPAEGIPGSIFSALFGFREIDVTSDERFMLDGRLIPAPYMSQRLKLLDNAEALAMMEDGSPAVVFHKTGKGQTLYFNSFIGIDLQERVRPQIRALISACLKNRQGMPHIQAEKSEGVHISCIENDTHKAMLLINFGDRETRVSITHIPAGTILTELFTAATLIAQDTTVMHLSGNENRIYVWAK